MYELKKNSELQEGRYVIDSVLGRGGFGITYQGTTNVTLSGGLGKMDVHVNIAIKEFFMNERCTRSDDGNTVLVPAEGSRPQVEKYKNKFIKEARKLADINHPNIVQVTDVFEENDTVYYVMSYLPGGSLSDLVKASPTHRLTEEEAVNYITQIGEALSYLHREKHICHFDVKPQNILLSEQGKAILIDFGIAKTFDESGNGDNSSGVSYTNHYAPIEQYQAITEFSPQTDLYSLGATMFYLLTGEAPAEASKLHEEGFPKCPYYVSEHVWAAIELAMKSRRKDRPASVAEWLQFLNKKEEPQSHGTASDETIVDSKDQETIVDRPKQAAKTPKAPKAKAKEAAEAADDVVVQKPAPAQKGKEDNKQKLIVLAVFVAAIIIGIGGYLMVSGGSSSPKGETAQTVKKLSTKEALQKLGSTKISYEEVLEICNKDSLLLHNGTREQEDTLRERMFTVGQIYMEFMKTPHNANNLINAYNLRANYLSKEQIKIMIWFINKPKAERDKWDDVDVQVRSFKEFKKVMADAIGE